MKNVWVYIGDSQMPVPGKIISDHGKQLTVKIRSTIPGSDWSLPVEAYRDRNGDIRFEPPPLPKNLEMIEQFSSTWRCLFCDRGNYSGRDKCKICGRPKAIAEIGPQKKPAMKRMAK